MEDNKIAELKLQSALSKDAPRGVYLSSDYMQKELKKLKGANKYGIKELVRLLSGKNVNK